MRFFPSVTALLLVAAPAFADSPSDTLRAELLAFNDQFNAYAASYDIEGMVSLYDEKALWIAPTERPVAGKETPRNTFTFLTENKGSLSHTVEELIVSDDESQAIMIGDAIVKVEKAGLDFTGTYMFVLERDGESWEIVTDMFNQHTKE